MDLRAAIIAFSGLLGVGLAEPSPSPAKKRRLARSAALRGKRLPDPPRRGRPFRRCPVTGLKLRA